MLAGYAATWATDDNSDNGSCEATVPISDTALDTAPGNAATADCTCVVNPVHAADASDATSDTKLVNPDKFSGGALNGVNVEATDVAPR